MTGAEPSILAQISSALVTLGVLGAIACGAALVLMHKPKTSGEQRPSLSLLRERAAGTSGHVAILRGCGFALTLNRYVPDIFSRMPIRQKVDVRYSSYVGLWVVDSETLSVWRSRTLESWSGFPAVEHLAKEAAGLERRIPLSQIGTLEVGSLSEIEHRATSSSHYLFFVRDGVTTILGRFKSVADARFVRQKLEEGVVSLTGSRTPPAARREGVPD